MSINIGLMLIVGGLLVFLHVRLNALRQTMAEMPKSAETIRKVLELAQQQMATLKVDFKNMEPLVKEGSRTAQDLDFMLHRANQILEKLEGHQQPNLLPTGENTQIKVPKGMDAKIVSESTDTLTPVPASTAADKLKARIQEDI